MDNRIQPIQNIQRRAQRASSFLVSLLLLVVAAPASAMLITIEPDNFAPDADISNAVSGAHLSAMSYAASRIDENGVTRYEPVFGNVYSHLVADGCAMFNQCAGTGDRVFGSTPGGSVGSATWGDARFGCVSDCLPYGNYTRDSVLFRMDLDAPTNYVDLLLNRPYDGAEVWGFNSLNQVVAKCFVSFGTDPCASSLSGDTRGWHQFSLETAGNDISYIIAGGISAWAAIDQVRFASVPEPGAALLFVAGLFALIIARKRHVRRAALPQAV